MKTKLFYLAIAVSLALSAWAHYFTHSTGLQFGTASLSVILLAALLGKATESVAHYAGERIGGFLNATFGNAAELIIATILIKEGMFDMVKASLTGSIIGNLLLVLGLSLFFGGLKFKVQKFNGMLAGHNASLMLLSVIALFIPAAFAGSLENGQLHIFSLVVAGALIGCYLLWLTFSMVTHKKELTDPGEAGHEEETPAWSNRAAILIMLISTIFVAVTSEWLVHSLHGVAESLHLSQAFLGIFVVAIVGNAAEHSAAIFMAMKNKIGTSVEIAVGSSLQIALFVAPVLVFISYLFGNPMDIIFSQYELVAIGVSAFIAKSISRDGATNWFEGILLLAVYIILGFGFYFV